MEEFNSSPHKAEQMEHSAATSLDSLPLLVLDRICEFLARSDDKGDEPEARRSLPALWSVSRACHFAADRQRFRQIYLAFATADGLRRSLDRWIDVLGAGTGARFRHVRRLKVEGPRFAEHDEEDRPDDVDEIGDEWATQHYFGMDDYFCRPRSFIPLTSPDIVQDAQAGQQLAEFVKKLPALEDLVWFCNSNITQPLLSHVETLGCRLHIHSFHLASLVQHRNDARPIDATEYALATSPSLCSIIVNTRMFETDGDLNYNDSAVMRMAAGASPRLAHVWHHIDRTGDSIAYREACRLGRPAWSGFFPGTTNADRASVLGTGSLHSLVLSGFVHDQTVRDWSRCIDFGNLRRLKINLSSSYFITAMEDIARGGNLKSLESLELSYWDDSPRMQNILAELLEGLPCPSLQRLDLDGFLSHETFDLALRCHGATLRSLSLTTDRSPEAYVWEAGLVSFSGAAVQRLAERCPRLEELKIPVPRTHGDANEAALYRALGRLPRLRRAYLTLRYRVGPAYIDGEDILTSTWWNGHNISRADLREALTNCAVDAVLARSIFDRASASGSSLCYLRLEVERERGWHPVSLYDHRLDAVMRWFSRSWVCRRNEPHGAVTVRELDKWETAMAGKAWQDEESVILEAAFKDIWPSQTQEWWKEWKSLRLSDNLSPEVPQPLARRLGSCSDFPAISGT